jgi:hypothetical protein
MSEAKTQCTACAAPILQRTFDKNSGLCTPCARAAAANPPEDFQLPSELVQRLMSMGFDPLNYREMAWRNGPSFVFGYLDRIEEMNARCDEWLPRLRQFAQKCREVLPPMPYSSLDSRDQAKLRIYEAKIASAEQIPPGTRSAMIATYKRRAVAVE